MIRSNPAHRGAVSEDEECAVGSGAGDADMRAVDKRLAREVVDPGELRTRTSHVGHSSVQKNMRVH